MQVGGVLEQYRHFASSISDGGCGWGSTLRLSKLQPLLTPEIDTKQMVGGWQKPLAKVCKKNDVFIIFKGERNTHYNLHTNHCEAVFRQDPIVLWGGKVYM